MYVNERVTGRVPMICFSARLLLGCKPSCDDVSVPTQSILNRSWVTATSWRIIRSKWYWSKTTPFKFNCVTTLLSTDKKAKRPSAFFPVYRGSWTYLHHQASKRLTVQCVYGQLFVYIHHPVGCISLCGLSDVKVLWDTSVHNLTPRLSFVRRLLPTGALILDVNIRFRKIT